MNERPIFDGVPPARILTWWFGLMAIGGIGFGLTAERRPFGDEVLAHPLVIFFCLAAAALLVLRFLAEKPVNRIISDRSLVVGGAIGLVCFLLGNWFGVNLGV